VAAAATAAVATVAIAAAGAAATAVVAVVVRAAAVVVSASASTDHALMTQLPEGVELTTLDSGVRVVTEVVPSVRSVALGLWVRTGSRDETPAQAGVSHFLEHLLFKGTDRHSAIEISELFDGMGAATNAATGKETTHLHARFLDEHTEEAFDLMAEMLLAPSLPPDEIDSEREVVLEEIAMYEDEPQDRVHDVLAEAIYGDHPLGRRVLGKAEVIGGIPVPDIASYHDARYTASNIVVSAAGHVEHKAIAELSERLLSPAGSENGAHANGDGSIEQARLSFYPKETEQYHICFGGPGISRGDERRFALAVLDTIFGGSVSSRLFREVREKRGLAYSVGSYTHEFVDRGFVAMYVGTRGDNVAEACEIIGRELVALRDQGVGEEELARAKEHVKGRMVLGLEATGSRMSRLARSVLLDIDVLSLDQMLERVDAVTGDEVAALATELYDPAALAAACVGPDEDCFKRAAGSVSEALSA
jgi:predicted Zn-dependent peptidase